MIERQPSPDGRPAIMVLGKNIGVDWTGERIRRTPGHLSTWSEVGSDSGGIAIEDGDARVVWYTIGNTAGQEPLSIEEARESGDLPGEPPKSEAEYQRTRFKRNFPHLADRAFIQPRSWDTNTDAKEARILIDNGEINEDYLLLATIGFHLARAEMLFRKAGIKANSTPTEDLVSRRDPDRKNELINSPLYQEEQKKERKLKFIMWFPLAADVITAITKRSRTS